MKTEPIIGMEVDHARRRVTTTWSGNFDLAAVAESCHRRQAEGAHSYRQFIDARKARVAEARQDAQTLGLATRDMADQCLKRGEAGPTAVVVGSQLSYGTCRAIGTYFEPAGVVQVFYDAAEALEWLEGEADGDGHK